MDNRSIRAAVYVIGDLAAIAFGILIAVSVVEEGPVFSMNNLWILTGLPVAFLIGLKLMRLYMVSWRHTGLHEMVRIFTGLTAGFAVFLLTSHLSGQTFNVDYGVAFLAFSTSILMIGGFRISRRLYNELLVKPHNPNSVIVFGAGNAGDQIIRDISRHPEWRLTINAIFDDEEALRGVEMQGVRIKGGRDAMYQYIKANKVRQLIIAAPSMPKKDLQNIISKVQKISSNVDIKILPSFHLLSDDPVGLKSLRDIRIEDILGRDTVEIDQQKISSFLNNQTVLITGAGGSIGSEIVRQVLKFNPNKIIAVEIDETEIFNLENELAGISSCIDYVVADVTNRNKMEALFQRYSVDMIYHAAAYKHVPMMERHPDEAVRVNVEGTRIVADLADKYQVSNMVMISTDKVVNPANVMGATKRVAEHICMSYNEISATNYVSVRFGNVLGSRGSVVPIFMDQIRKGGPVTITDSEMKRYFMTIPEAVLLVMQAGTMGKGGEVFVLDMGEPVKIRDMAEQLIKLHGLKPEQDIPITVNGLRPGEKLFEELLTDEEGVDMTTNEQIFKARCTLEMKSSVLNRNVQELIGFAENFDDENIRMSLRKLVPSFKYTQNGHQNNNDEESMELEDQSVAVR